MRDFRRSLELFIINKTIKMETLKIDNMDLKTKKIAFLGYGSMIQGITRKLFDNNIIDKSKCLSVTNSGTNREKGVKFSTNHSEITDFDIIFIGYKQNNLREEEIYQNMNGKIVISIIAGITEEELQKKFRGAKIVRAMPNRGSVVGEGCTFLKFSRDFTAAEKEMVGELFLASGKSYRIETTEQIDQGTIFSASMFGIIAFFRNKIHNTLKLAEIDDQKSREFFAELENIITKLAKETALVSGKSEQIIHQTFLGVEKLAEKFSYSDIQKSVTSPNGTTQAMIENLEKNNIDKFLTDIFGRNSLNSKKINNLSEFLNNSCHAGLARAQEMSRK